MTSRADQVVVVAGVGPGLGRAVALASAREGAAVVLAARTATRLEEVRAEIVASGGRAIAVPTDVADGSQCTALAQAALDAYGSIDVLVHTSFARPAPGLLRDRTARDWHESLDGNVLAATQLVHAVAPTMRAQGAGAVVLVSSVSARQPFPQSGIYATMKAALLTLTKVFAQELGADGIRVNCVVPGYIDGPGLERFFETLAAERGTTAAAARASVASVTCLGRIPSADEVAAAVMFFASAGASGITGQSLDVNGGQWFG
ncbi:MAG TPA: SDR family oxidoreductase [Acidimicrobiales bacterium]|jgi:NAD(P)-dependent dehydrogenase (short-subunit alcohol dehydrogenase family)|nr:SDR family oxidoreductase [Acidimicrobiales bacterium]